MRVRGRWSNFFGPAKIQNTFNIFGTRGPVICIGFLILLSALISEENVMPLTINEFGEICRILIFLHPLAESDSHSARYPEVTNFSVVLRVYILCRIVFCVKNTRKTGQIFYLHHYMKYPSHSADLHGNQHSWKASSRQSLHQISVRSFI